MKYCAKIQQIENYSEDNLDEENPYVYLENNILFDKADRAIEYFVKCSENEAFKQRINYDKKVDLGLPVFVYGETIDYSKSNIPVYLTTDRDVVNAIERGHYLLPDGYVYKQSTFTKGKGLEISQRILSCEFKGDYLNIRLTNSGKDLFQLIYDQCFVNALHVSLTITITDRFYDKKGKCVKELGISAQNVESYVDYQMLKSVNPSLKNYKNEITINCYLETKVLS